MEWLNRLLGSVVPGKTEGSSLQDGIMGALREAIPPQLQETASHLFGEAPVRDLLQRGELPTQQVTDGAQQALDAAPKKAGGFVEQGMAVLKDRFKL
jgi:hypothetical protein